ncbi:hypothetical protein PAXRUDRAFT_18355 [Paxillus rubicundulus Ve08.2h10]|uniref:Unplaced genomic scaffold scaffold_2777, whole genome shotgun sequence n=1 Tax=Paxillus rubicundulus Ve08.2h10 TaxID=930991 RepID=A0A0D0D7I3_9AGAM|nr:hypothetical protein PAXRUDRAFT_18355 [Paxillus rubicundulus Ve08.2h10]
MSDHTFVHTDYFEEMQDLLDQGELLFGCPLHHPDDELGIETDDSNDDRDNDLEPSDGGIEIQEASFRMNNWGKNTANNPDVPDDAPTFPWSSIQEFAMHLLFSSPRLCFSEAQKKSVLSWVTALGVTGVPSLYSLKKIQEQIKNLFGNLTEKVTATSSNIFYLNSISKALAMDFANPLTCFFIQDYPKEGEGQMSQVHHRYKMLEGLPEDLAPPCVCINKKIFFINELLQQASRHYFIPKKYFQVKLGIESESEAEVLSLGHLVSVTDMGFSVDPQLVAVKTLMFGHMIAEIKASPTEFGWGFTWGTMAEKKTDSGYSDIFKASELWTPENTLSDIKGQANMANLSGGTEKVKTAVSQTGTCDAATAAIVDYLLDLGKWLRKWEEGKPAISEVEVHTRLEHEFKAALDSQSLENHINPLLGMASMDIHQDTPTEILHTILLGVMKYYWDQTVYIIPDLSGICE